MVKSETLANNIINCYDNYNNIVDLTDENCTNIKLELAGKHAKSTDKNFMIIDKEYLPLVLEYKWYLSKSGYPMTHGTLDRRQKFSVGWKLHSFLHNHIKLDKSLVIDHIDRNKLNNRMQNLRICTQRQNSYNTSKRKGNATSQYKGVIKNKNGDSWSASITKEGKTTKISNIETEEEAAKIYDMMAEQLFGEYAGKNF